MQSCETPRNQNYIIPTISTPNNHAERIGAMSASLLNLNTAAKLPPVRR